MTNPDPYETELDRLFGAPKDLTAEAPIPTPGTAPLRTYGHAPQYDNRAPQPVDKSSPYFDKCVKCGGSGSFYSNVSGRYLGPCRACKGQGGTMRATTNEERAHRHTLAKARKVRSTSDNIMAFTRAHPAQMDWLITRRATFDFAQSLYDAVLKYGSLTDNQLAAIDRILTADAAKLEAAKARVEAAPVVTNVDLLKAAFEKASASGLKKPHLHFEGFQASLAPATGKNPGAIYLKDGPTYLGKILNGKLQLGRDAPATLEALVLAAMADPLAQAIAYGKRTGRCSCCGRELTDPVSVAKGIGPICEANFF